MEVSWMTTTWIDDFRFIGKWCSRVFKNNIVGGRIFMTDWKTSKIFDWDVGKFFYIAFETDTICNALTNSTTMPSLSTMIDIIFL